MYLIVTRSFPPELGGMQSLMWGLAKEMSKNFMIKVFADYHKNHKEFDQEANFSILLIFLYTEVLNFCYNQKNLAYIQHHKF